MAKMGTTWNAQELTNPVDENIDAAVEVDSRHSMRIEENLWRRISSRLSWAEGRNQNIYDKQIGGSLDGRPQIKSPIYHLGAQRGYVGEVHSFQHSLERQIDCSMTLITTVPAFVKTRGGEMVNEVRFDIEWEQQLTEIGIMLFSLCSSSSKPSRFDIHISRPAELSVVNALDGRTRKDARTWEQGRSQQRSTWHNPSSQVGCKWSDKEKKNTHFIRVND